MESLGRTIRYWYLLAGVGLAAAVGWGIRAGRNQPTAMPPSVITGRVLTPGGQPVAGARVYFGQAPVALPDVALLTDPSGTFALSAPVPGTYQLDCAAAGFSVASVAVTVAAGQPAHVDIRLHR